MALGIVKIYLESPFSASQRCSQSVCSRSVGTRSVVVDPKIYECLLVELSLKHTFILQIIGVAYQLEHVNNVLN